MELDRAGEPCDSLILIPEPASVRRLAIEPTIVTSRPSRIHTVPRPTSTSQCQLVHGSRSKRAGMRVSMPGLQRATLPPCSAPRSATASPLARLAKPAAPRRGQASSAVSTTRPTPSDDAARPTFPGRWTSGDIDLGVEYQADERVVLLILGRLFGTVGRKPIIPGSYILSRSCRSSRRSCSKPRLEGNHADVPRSSDGLPFGLDVCSPQRSPEVLSPRRFGSRGRIAK
jgi:hypothetical protein